MIKEIWHLNIWTSHVLDHVVLDKDHSVLSKRRRGTISNCGIQAVEARHADLHWRQLHATAWPQGWVVYLNEAPVQGTRCWTLNSGHETRLHDEYSELRFILLAQLVDLQEFKRYLQRSLPLLKGLFALEFYSYSLVGHDDCYQQ